MRRSSDDEFFIGYAPPMPARVARFVRHVVLTLAVCSIIWSVTLVRWHSRLDGGTFAFGHPLAYAGTIVERPYPALIGTDGTARLLVAPGKHGADSLVRGLEGTEASLMGTPIERNHRTMIEVDPGSLTQGSRSPSALLASESQPESIEAIGEVVDTKCYLGVMVPGSGKTHRACASLCLRGGIPPGFQLQDGNGRSALLLLTGPTGERVSAAAMGAAGRLIELTGTIRQEHGWRVLLTDPASWRPVNARR